ncbi:MAG: Kelch repeat-containing protein, partial [Candidatus Binatia bacterium]
MDSTFLKFLRIAALCMALGAWTATAHSQSQGSWTTKAPIPLARNEVALAAVGGKIHVIGGGIKGVAGPYHDEYDPATDRWRTRAPLPQGLDHIGAAVLNGKIYTVGGFVASVHKDGQPHVFGYDPATDTWRSLSALKSGLGSVAVTVLDGKIHAVGGRNPAGQTVATHQVYDPATDAW